MIEVDRPYVDPRSGTVITLLRNDPEVFEVEARIPAGLGRSRPHRHMDFEQAFTVVAGRVAAELHGGRRTLAPGEELEVPAGVPHQDPWNPGPDVAVVRNRVWPNPPFLPIYAETVLARMLKGKVPDSGDINPLQIAVISQQTGSQSYLAKPGIEVQRRILPAMAALGRRLGLGPETLSPGA